jgi:hypothetical protein
LSSAPRWKNRKSTAACAAGSAWPTLKGVRRSHESVRACSEIRDSQAQAFQIETLA